MESLISIEEKIFTAVVIAIYVVYAFYQIFNSDMIFNTNDLKIIWLVYGTMLLSFTISVVRESLLYTRINIESVEILKPVKISFEIIKSIILVLIHISFWILMKNGNIAYLTILVAFGSQFNPIFISKTVYEGEGYLIHNGTKYYYDNIQSYKDEEFYKIRLSLNTRKRILRCRNSEEYDFILSILKEKVIV